jgi:hypothetical protein
MTKVAIHVENGKVTIMLGGHSTPTTASGTVVDEGRVGEVNNGAQGGEGSCEGTDTGGGGPGHAGCLVIGPIVIPNSLRSGDGTGGEGSCEGTDTGGEGSCEGTDTGGGGPGHSGCVVIGPIVFCGNSGGGASTSATPIDINPE